MYLLRSQHAKVVRSQLFLLDGELVVVHERFGQKVRVVSGESKLILDEKWELFC